MHPSQSGGFGRTGAGKAFARSALAAGILALSGVGGPALAASSVEAFAGAVGGVATTGVPGDCSTYGAPEPEASFFPNSRTMFVPVGGIAACGYGGGLDDRSGASAPLTATQSLASVLLGNPGAAGTWSGSANAAADYKVLKADAHGAITSPGAGSPTALGNASAVAIFEDDLTATSPLVTMPSAGFVRYTFLFEGTLQTPGPIVANIPGSAEATLHIEHDHGSNTPIVSVDTDRGGTGTLVALDGSKGAFVAGVGSIGGSGSFTSALPDPYIYGGVLDQSFTWGQPFHLKVGLMATVVGDGDADFQSTARLTRIDFFDASHSPVGTVTVSSGSGVFYGVCSYSIAPTERSVGSSGDTGNVAVTTQADCPWTAASNDAFISITSGVSGAGSGSVGYSVAPNDGPARSGTATIAGLAFTVAQDGPPPDAGAGDGGADGGPDAGPEPDAGSGSVAKAPRTGSGCSTGGPGMSMLIVLWLLRRGGRLRQRSSGRAAPGSH